MTLNNATFANNSAAGGSSFDESKGLGGGLFIMQSLTNSNGNNQGMPTVLPTVTANDLVIFSGNSAADDSGTVTDNDDVWGTVVGLEPFLTISDVTTFEGDDAINYAIFVVSLSGSSEEIISVNYVSADGDLAIAGIDYTPQSGTLIFNSGEISKIITVPVLGDSFVESNESFFVNLSNASNAIIADDQGICTIKNDDPLLSINDVTVLESDDGLNLANFVVTLSDPSGKIITVNYETADGEMAIAGIDYIPQSGTLIFNPGETSQIISIPIIGESFIEDDETFFVNISNINNIVIADNQGVGTIVNDDVLLSVNDVAVEEGEPNSNIHFANFTVTLSSLSQETITVSYATADGELATADIDYTPQSGTLIFNPGETTKIISVPIIGDNLIENNESFFVTLSNPSNAIITDSQGIGTIKNDDPLLSIDNVILSEGNEHIQYANFTLTLTGPSEEIVTVSYATSDGELAIAGIDYTPQWGTVVFNPGEISQTISIPIIGDYLEESNESFFVYLRNVSNATVVNNKGVGTIEDDDLVSFLVKDINTEIFIDYHYHLSSLTAVGNVLYFLAESFGNPDTYELWKSDGTMEGTTFISSPYNPRELTAVEDTLYFINDDGSYFVDRLYSVDINSEELYFVDINSDGLYGPNPSDLTAVGNMLYFVADDGVHGRELWKTDGSAAGASLVADLYTGLYDSTPSDLTAVGNMLYFVADDGVHGRELWKTDGTTAGTSLVADLYTGLYDLNPSDLTAVGNMLYFVADDGVHGRELWKTDDSETGASLATDLYTGLYDSNPSDLTAVDNMLYFVADDGVHGRELWKTDITTTDIALVLDLYTGSSDSDPNHLTVMTDTLCFFAYNENGHQLWKYDGNSVFNITPNNVDIYGSDLVSLNNTLYFSDWWEGLWKSNGTIEGTSFVSDLSDLTTPTDGSDPSSLTAVGDILYFAADDGMNGRELWKSDGTTAGTILVKDIGSWSSSYPLNLTAVGNTLYFVAQDDINGSALWKSDGTTEGTLLVKDISPDFWTPDADNLTAVGNVLYFVADDGVNGRELWKSDGTTAGTILVKDLNAGSFGSDPRNLIAVGETLFFVANDGVSGFELWKSDGTPEGTIAIKDISPDFWSSDPSSLTVVGNVLYFVADDGVNGRELWKSDGTTTGTILVKDLNAGSFGSDPSSLAVVGNTLYFAADDGVNGRELWKSDGTAEGTTLVNDIQPGAPGSDPNHLTPVGETLYFSANDGVNGRELWKSDGTSEGTTLVKDIFTGHSNASSSPRNLTSIGNALYFVAEDSTSGYELWRSDGTDEGTILVDDIYPGLQYHVSPDNLTAVGNTLYFTASDGFTSYDLTELWAVNVFQPTIPGVIQLNNSTYTVVENGTVISAVTLIRSDGNDGEVSVKVTPSTGTASSPADFDNSAIVVNFADGETTKTVTISIVNDTLIEGDETLNLILSNPTGGTTLGAQTTAVLTIIDDDFSGGEAIMGTEGDDVLVGTSADDLMMGLGGNDRLEGKGGADEMRGGLGNDTYTVKDPGDLVVENLNEGADAVKTYITYVLPDNVENLTLLGTRNLDGTGNSLNNKLTGNNGDNVLTGGAGNDTLDGKAGNDRLRGGLGDDTYLYRHPGSVIVENRNKGMDTVKAYFSYGLEENLENLTLMGSDDLDGIGNSLNNKLTGNSGDNLLNGGAGADSLTGKGGADTFIFNFSQSLVTAPDWIKDFTLGEDKIDLLTQGGGAISAPVNFTRAADSKAPTLTEVMTQVFTDANGAVEGNQALGINSAALVKVTTPGIRGTYLVVNNSNALFQADKDLLVNLTGLSGALPDFGAVPVDSFFV
ncbi:MAG: ELWxxDGT repeat protein [Cyanobacteriota bacterium]